MQFKNTFSKGLMTKEMSNSIQTEKEESYKS